jgi:hypothetical protein
MKLRTTFTKRLKSEGKIMSKTAILSCNCKHGYQDRTYGVGKRVCNVGKTGDKASCTVCGKDQFYTAPK